MANLLGVAFLIAGLSASVQANIAHECRTSLDCGGDSLGILEPSECCLDSPLGLSYSTDTGCISCVVYGFLEDSYTGIEQGENQNVAVGYRKGAGVEQRDLDFNVRAIPGTAREGSNFDYTLSTNQVTVSYTAENPEIVQFIFRADSLAQEPNETLTLELLEDDTPLSEGLYLRNTLEMTIIDSNVVQISFVEDDFRGDEEDTIPHVPVVVTKDLRIATQVVLELVPLTIDPVNLPSLLAEGIDIPTNNIFSPPYADSEDFNNTVIIIVYDPDENIAENEKGISIPIFDDLVDEAAEQVFLVRLNLINSLDPASVILTKRNVSLCRIRDNDNVRIGFEFPRYTYTEPMFEELIDNFYLPPPGSNDSGAVFLVKENDVVSEQTFQVVVQVTSTAPSDTPSIQVATLNEDYSLGLTDTAVFSFLATQQRLVLPFTLFSDEISEGTEAFRAISSSGGQNTEIPEYLRPLTLTQETFVIIEDDDDPIIIGFEETQYTFDESVGILEVFVSILNPTDVILPTTIPVVVQTVAKSAVGGEDYEQIRSDTRDVVLMFDDATRRLSFNVTILDDDFPEFVEDFDIELSFDPILNVAPAGVLLSPDISTLTIADDDPIIIGFEQTEYNVLESVGMLEVYVRVLNPPDNLVFPASNIDLPIQTISRSAVSEEDFEEIDANLSEIILIFDEITRRLAFNVTIYDDDQSETIEEFDLQLILDTFQLTLGVQLFPNVSTIAIMDNDGQNLDLTVSFDKESYTVRESELNVEVCFSTNMGHDQAIEVIIQPVEKDVINKAGRDTDFDARPITQIFEASPDSSSTLCANITLIPDVVHEGDEQFLVIFGNLPNSETGVFVGQINQTCITITDEDEPVFKIGPNTIVNESTPTVEICVSTETSLSQNIVVTAVTVTKTGENATIQATENLDYIPKTINLTFSSVDEGLQEKCSLIDIIDDILGNEPNEVFSVKLINVLVEGNDEACITIIDDDTPEIEWEITETTIQEGNMREVCFNTDIGTATAYDVEIGAREKSANPARSNDYEIQPVSQTITIPVSPIGGRFCIDVIINSDTEVEEEEQFELYFVNVSNDYFTLGDNETVCVTINDGATPPPPPDKLICLITEPVRVKPFARTSTYSFMGMCEHIAVSSCVPILGTDVRVTVDFLTGSMENGAVGLHINDYRYVSREDGSFDDGGQTPISSSPSHREYLLSPIQVFVTFGVGMTNITLDIIDEELTDYDIEIDIIHSYAGDSPFIQIDAISPNGSLLENCGLCGSHSGQLLKPDGTVVNNMDQIQEFAQCYIVEAREQILRPQRRECGIIRNDTVIGDPLYAAPVYSEDGKEYSLCYEVFGRINSTLNLVSDTCVSVNARYSPMNNPDLGNIISSIGVRAKGVADNSCHNIQVDIDGCSATINSPGDISRSLSNMESFQQDGISVRKYPSRVRISAPNCENVMLVMWVICENQNDQDMIKFVIARGVNLRASSHGLLGQFWNIPVTFTNYTGNDIPPYYAPEDIYVVTVEPESSLPRSFLGEFYQFKWDNSRGPCLYVGNAQGGPGYEVEDPNDSVIEGSYSEYIIQSGDLFETNYKYVQFEENRCVGLIISN